MRKPLYAVILTLCIFFCGCGKSEPITPAQPLTAAVVWNDVRMTVTSIRSIYREGENGVTSDNPYDITAEVSYIGDAENVKLTYDNPSIHVDRLENGEYRAAADFRCTYDGREFACTLELPFYYLEEDAALPEGEINAQFVSADYTFTLTSPQRTINDASLDRAAPFDLTAKLTYVGAQDAMNVTHADPLIGITVEPPDSGIDSLGDFFYNMVSIEDRLERNVPVMTTQTGSYLNHALDAFPIGNYIAAGHTWFDDADGNRISIDISLPLVVE
ncbi:MAG: hypothetical protein IJ493_04755 [Clostridia bacterium]|nr:hypothetical protein [Clostridia bacterium]